MALKEAVHYIEIQGVEMKDVAKNSEVEGNPVSVAIKVQDIMTTDLFTLYESDNLQMLDEMMKWRAIRHIPVIDDTRRIVGIMTHRDLLKVSASVYDLKKKQSDENNYKNLNIGDVMARNLVTITPEIELKRAAKIMFENKLGCLPVVDGENKVLVGIITEADFVKFFVEQDFFAF